MARSRLRCRTQAWWWVALFLCAPLPLPAQSITVTGQILHRGRIDRPLAGQWAVLGKFRTDTSGPVDSTRTDGAGRYRLALQRADTAALYFVSTTFEDVDYSTRTLRVEGRRLVEPEPILVYDTTTADPPMRLERRLITLIRATRGGLSVLELIEVANPGNRTRIARDSLSPVWMGLLPSHALAWAAKEGDLPPDAVWFGGDTVKVFAPIRPGVPLHTSYEYTLSGSTARIPVDQWTREIDLLIEDTTAVPSGAVFEPLGIHDLEGRRLAAYRAGPLEKGTELSVVLSRGPLRAEQLVPYLAGATALVLAWGLWVALMRKRSEVRNKPAPAQRNRR